MISTRQKNTIEIQEAVISEEKKSIIYIRIKPGVHLESENMKNIHEAKEKIAGGRKYAVIFIPDNTSSISKEAREFAASEIVFKNAICKAIIAKNISHRIIGNFFINFQRPLAPMKIFKHENAALTWVNSKIKESQ